MWGVRRAIWLVYPAFYVVAHVLPFDKIPWSHVFGHHLQSTTTLDFSSSLSMPLQLSYTLHSDFKKSKTLTAIFGTVFVQIKYAIYR
jgi:hypothetical protein